MANWLEDYLSFMPDFRDPMTAARAGGQAAALRRYAKPNMTPTGGPLDNPFGNVGNEPMMGGEPTSVSTSPAPGIQTKPADTGAQVGDSRWDPNFTNSYMDSAALSSEDQGLAAKGELIDSLRGRRYKTGIGGGIGAAGEVLATVAALQNIEKRNDVRGRYMDELRKSLTRNSATGGREVDPTRDL